MAEYDENSMIGYDPLAWLHENSESTADDAHNELPFTADNAIHSDFSDTATYSEPADCEPDTEVEPHSGFGALNEEFQAMDSVAVEVENAEPNNQSFDTASNQIVLESVQNIQNVLLLHQKLQNILDTEEKIDIDASAVTQIDTATLQLLLVLKLSAAKLQKEVNIDFPSQKFIDAAYLLGLAEMLSVDQAASGLF